MRGKRWKSSAKTVREKSSRWNLKRRRYQRFSRKMEIFSRDNDLCHVKKWDEPRLKHRKNSIGEMSFQEY